MDPRSEARRDRDRILYSDAWRRLSGVTQVITPFEDLPLMHNRLTHSQKVAQLGRTIAEALIGNADYYDLIPRLGGIDADVVDAAGLAHDLGHAPFAHIGEHTLDRIARAAVKEGGLGLSDGFEGNAQTLRIALLCEVRSPRYDGLDLTCATLVALTKYPWPRTTTVNDKDHQRKLDSDADYRRHWRKFSVYEPELAAFKEARQTFLDASVGQPFGEETQSLEASIMDAADDITYAIHDLEDFYLAGILDLDYVVSELRSSGRDLADLKGRLELDYPGYYDHDTFDLAAGYLIGRLNQGLARRRHGHNWDSRVANIKSLTSDLMARYVEGMVITDHPAWGDRLNGWGPFVALRQEQWHEVQILKELTKRHVITRPDIALLQRGQQKILEDLVRYLVAWTQSKDDFGRLPGRLRQQIDLARAQQNGGKLPGGYHSDDEAERPMAPRGDENRCILDYLCTLTDGQTYALHNKLVGAKIATMMDFFS